jgi:hypothetical protein
MDTKIERLTKALLAERKHETKQDDRIIPCFVCGFRFIKKDSLFCSDRCRDWYDAGHAPISNADNYDLTGWRVISCVTQLGPTIGSDYYAEALGRQPIDMRPGRDGFYIRCAHCHREFESKGLRCCSTECERGLKEHRDNLAVMAEAGIEVAAKRTCQQCGAIIPKWTAGKRTPSTKRFCSAKCAQRARRAEEAILKPTT